MAMPTLRTILAPCALAALLAGLTGCGPSPESVCQHIIDLMSEELKAKGAELPEDKRSKSHETCIERAEDNKKDSAMEYKKEASCVMAAQSLAEVKACSEPGST